MRVKWTQFALTDFLDAQAYIARENPQAAQEVARRIKDATHKLRDYPYIGRPGEDDDTREWLVQKTPYLVIYEIRANVIEITRVWHTRRQRAGDETPPTA